MNKKITGGLYLVVDPAMGLDILLPKIEQAIEGGIDVLQVWNNWSTHQNKQQVINAICTIAHAYNIPVIINEEWELIMNTALDGVHFDAIPPNYQYIQQTIGKSFICGITCGNDLNRVQWATENNLDYISFCSMFPSPSAGACEIVSKATVQQARQMTSQPIFLAGGITLDNINELTATGMDGIALISAIMKADDPQTTSKTFKNKLNIIQHETIIN